MSRIKSIIVLVMMVMLVGCGVFNAPHPVYPDSGETEPKNLSDVTAGDFTMKFPPGWEAAPFQGESEDVRAIYIKTGTSLQVKVVAMKAITGVRAVPLKAARAIMSNQLPGTIPDTIAGPYALSNSIAAPYYEKLGFTIINKGRETQMGAYTGWNLARNYASHGVLMVGAREEIDKEEATFRAIIRTF